MLQRSHEETAQSFRLQKASVSSLGRAVDRRYFFPSADQQVEKVQRAATESKAYGESWHGEEKVSQKGGRQKMDEAPEFAESAAQRLRVETGKRRRTPCSGVTKAPLIHNDCRAERMLNPQKESGREENRYKHREQGGNRVEGMEVKVEPRGQIKEADSLVSLQPFGLNPSRDPSRGTPNSHENMFLRPACRPPNTQTALHIKSRTELTTAASSAVCLKNGQK